MADITLGLTVTPVIPEDNFLTADPTSQRVVQGVVAIYQVGIDPAANVTAPVFLTVLDEPVGAVCEIVPSEIVTGEIATLTIITDAIAPSETEYVFRVHGELVI